MTLPTTINLPLRVDYSSFEDINRYLADFTYEIQSMYEQLAQGVNGDIKANVYTQKENWTPTLKGTGVAGSFTYANQIGWVLRRGLHVTVWFDVRWTVSGAAAGNLYLELPYKVANSAQKPFSNTIQPSSLAYGAGVSTLHINAISNTFRGEIWTSGSGIATANFAVAGSGQLIGSLSYMGV